MESAVLWAWPEQLKAAHTKLRLPFSHISHVFFSALKPATGMNNVFYLFIVNI